MPVDGVTVFIQKVNPSIHFLSIEEIPDWQVSSSDEHCSDGIVLFDGEHDIGSRMSAVYVERLVPSGIRVLFQQPGSANPGLFQIYCGIEFRSCIVEADSSLDGFSNLYAKKLQKFMNERHQQMAKIYRNSLGITKVSSSKR